MLKKSDSVRFLCFWIARWRCGAICLCNYTKFMTQSVLSEVHYLQLIPMFMSYLKNYFHNKELHISINTDIFVSAYTKHKYMKI